MKHTQTPKHGRPKAPLRRIVLAGVMAVAAAFILIAGYQLLTRHIQASQNQRMLDQLRAQQPSPTAASPSPTAAPSPAPTAAPTPTQAPPSPTPQPEPTMMAQYQALGQQYPDFAGWLQMPALEGVDYPVVQAEDNDYYLKRDINGDATVYGSMYMDFRNSRMPLDDNTILYGHNMRDGAMLGQLKKYKKADFALSEAARTITFNTPYQQYRWKVFAIYLVDITTYLDFYRIDFEDEAAFNTYIDYARTHSMVDYTDVPVQYGDKLLSLYTCDAAGDDYRLILHAVLEES